MGALFELVLSASLYGSILIVVVCLLRILLKSAPRKLTCLLWLLVGLRLLMPFEFESDFSLQPKLPQTEQTAWIHPAESSSEARGEILNAQGEVIATRPITQGWGEILNSQGEILIRKPLKPVVTDNGVALENLLPWFWIAGVATMGIYSVIACLRLKRRARDSIVLEDGIWFCSGLDTAFVLGLFRPQIYLPGLMESEIGFVVAHEKAHISRKDHWWKFLGYVALAIHWFNPLVWLGYILLCRDLEMACDEAVIQSLELADRKAYSHALLSCSARHSLIGVCPVAFGEVSVGERIKNVLKYRKPKLWICVIAVLSVIGAAVCFLTVPSTKDEEIAARLGGNVFTWEKKELGIFSFEIELDEDGTCHFYDGVDPAYMGLGAWWVEDGILKIRDDGTMKYRYFYFWVDGKNLIYLADKSDAFSYTEVVDGDRFYMIQDIGNAEEKLTQCRDAFETWLSYENYHVNRHDWCGGDALTSTYEADYWRAGDDWLHTWHNPEIDGINGGCILVKNGVGYHTIYQFMNSEENTDNSEWSIITNGEDMAMAGNWFEEFIWENASIQYVRTDIINENKERVTLSVVKDWSDFGRYCPYTVEFYFDSDGVPLFVSVTQDSNKGEHKWMRTVSSYYCNNIEDTAAQIEGVYAECPVVLGKEFGTVEHTP